MRTFNSNEDVYRFTNEIILQARDNGDKNIVDLLENAVSRGGFLPSERLGALRIAYSELLKIVKDGKMNYPVQEIKMVIGVINKAFRRSNRPF